MQSFYDQKTLLFRGAKPNHNEIYIKYTMLRANEAPYEMFYELKKLFMGVTFC